MSVHSQDNQGYAIVIISNPSILEQQRNSLYTLWICKGPVLTVITQGPKLVEKLSSQILQRAVDPCGEALN
jgi:hypothetical protein